MTATEAFKGIAEELLRQQVESYGALDSIIAGGMGIELRATDNYDKIIAELIQHPKTEDREVVQAESSHSYATALKRLGYALLDVGSEEMPDDYERVQDPLSIFLLLGGRNKLVINRQERALLTEIEILGSDGTAKIEASSILGALNSALLPIRYSKYDRRFQIYQELEKLAVSRPRGIADPLDPSAKFLYLKQMIDLARAWYEPRNTARLMRKMQENRKSNGV